MNRLGVSPVLHRALPGGGERRLGGGDARTEPLGAEGDEVVVEVAARGHEGRDCESVLSTACIEPLGARPSRGVVVTGDEHSGNARGWGEDAEPCGRERGGGAQAGAGGQQRERGLDGIARCQRRSDLGSECGLGVPMSKGWPFGDRDGRGTT